MKINTLDVEATLNITKTLLDEETDLSPALRSIIDVLIMLVSVLLNRATLNSHSHRPAIQIAKKTNAPRQENPQQDNTPNNFRS